MEALKWIIQISFMVALVFLGVQPDKNNDKNTSKLVPSNQIALFTNF